ncbi:MAG: hypothetical protein ACRCWQ_03810, partial [Bacilli bacterium]
MVLSLYGFQLVCQIEPERLSDGSILKYEFSVEQPELVHRYGSGPFCEFRIPREFTTSGVYAITQNDKIVYVGGCSNLSKVFNNGFGKIHMSSTLKNGQQTFCRMNNFILSGFEKGEVFNLFWIERKP